MDTYQLEVWKNEWGLPSIDIDCLQVLAYAKFAQIPVNVTVCGNLFKTPHGRLPLLKTGRQTLESVKEILEFFRQKNYNIDNALSFNDCTLVAAYEQLLKEQLLPAMQYVWWIDKRNVDELIRPLYSKALPFPFKFYYLSRFEQDAHALLNVLHPIEYDNSTVEVKVYMEAQKCLTLLSTRLGTSEYFFGDQPTTLDAIIYSYLAPLLHAPLPNKSLQNHLKSCTNLADYVARITKRYFSHEEHEYKQKIARENERKMKADLDPLFPNKRRNQILAGLFATFAMVSYALSTGIVEVPIQDDEMEPPEDYILDDGDAE